MNSGQNQQLSALSEQPPPPSSEDSPPTAQLVQVPSSQAKTRSSPRHPPSSTHTSSPPGQAPPSWAADTTTVSVQPPPTPSSQHSPSKQASRTNTQLPEASTVQHSQPPPDHTVTAISPRPPPTAPQPVVTRRSPPEASAVQQTVPPSPGLITTTVSPQPPPPAASQPVVSQCSYTSPPRPSAVHHGQPPPGQILTETSPQPPPAAPQPTPVSSTNVNPGPTTIQPGQTLGQTTATSIESHPPSVSSAVPRTSGQITTTVSCNLPSSTPQSIISTAPHSQLPPGQSVTNVSPRHPLATPSQYSPSQQHSYSSGPSGVPNGHQVQQPTPGQFATTISPQHPPPSSQYSPSQPQYYSYIGPEVSAVRQHGRSSPSSHSIALSQQSSQHHAGAWTGQHGHPPPSSQYPQPSYVSPGVSTVHHRHPTPPSFSSHSVANPSAAAPHQHQHQHPAPVPAPTSSYAMPSGDPTIASQHQTGYIAQNPNISQYHGHSASGGSSIHPSAGYGMPPNPQASAVQYGAHSSFGVQGLSIDSYNVPRTGASNLPYQAPYCSQTGYAGWASSTSGYTQLHVLPNQGAPGTSRPAQGKIFVLYCKDPQLPPEFSDDVLDLADILSHCGGFLVMIDHYINVHPPNWNIWTQQKIEESQYVLLVCSPTFAHVLREPGEWMLDMEKGKYYAHSIVNYVQPQKFIPVFLNQFIPRNYLEWVPKQLHASAVYSLNVSKLGAVLTGSEDVPRHVFDEKLRRALSDDQFREIAKLVNHLRDESATSPPVPPPRPIEVPPTSSFPHYTHVPRTGLAEPIPRSALETIAERMPRDWFTLGVKLGVPSTQLERLRSKHSFNHVPAALEMLSLWQQIKGRLATRRALKDVLVRMEYGRLAKELFPNE